MITEIEIGNVRVFDGRGWRFPLPPLTVFCGTNGSGKSTILKTLLLLRQSHFARETLDNTPRLRFVGDQIDLGSFVSFVAHNQTTNDISIAVGITDEMRRDSVSFLRSLKIVKDADANDDEDEVPDDPEPEPYSLKAEFTFGAPQEAESKSSGAPPQKQASQNLPAVLKKAEFVLKVGDEVLLDWRVESVVGVDGPKYKMYLPNALFDRVGGFKIMMLDPCKSEYVDLDVVLNGLLPYGILAREKNDKESGEQSQSLQIFPIPPFIETFQRTFSRWLIQVNYLGPLRAPAKRYYVANLDGPPKLDARGEFLPYVLLDRQLDSVTTVEPHGTAIVSKPLKDALNSWLYYFRTGKVDDESKPHDEVQIEVTNDVLVEFRLRAISGSETHALADSGFGYSQTLPILVRALLAAPGSTLVIEQPELHLNPALQVRLGEFFVAMVRGGLRVLIETHSEHIVNSIRVSAAEDESGDFSSKCRIFYLRPDGDKMSTVELSIRRDGTVPEWPYEFFGEAVTLGGRLLRAQRGRKE